MQLTLLNSLPEAYPGKTIVRDEQAFEAMMRQLRVQPVLGFDYETSGTAYYQHARPCGIAFGCLEKDRILTWYVPYRHQTGEAQLPWDVVSRGTRELLENVRSLKVAQNIKFDEHMAHTEGILVLGPRYDTMIAARLFDENRSAALKFRAESDLGHADAKTMERALVAEVARLAKSRKLNKTAYLSQYGYAQTPVELCGVYACYDVQFTLELMVKYETWGLSGHYPRIWPTEMALTEVLCGMEENGLLVDVGYLEALRGRLTEVLAGLESRIFAATGRRFKLTSDDELRQYLRGDLNLSWTKQTKGHKWAVDHEVLEELIPKAPIARLILEYRTAHKLVTTYTTSILKKLDSSNFLHGDFQQVGADTGRLSCRTPNLQNFSKDDNSRAKAHSGKSLEDGGVDPWSIRRAFVNRGPGWVRLCFDYSQIELRVLAHYTQDPIMVRAYLDGEDIHSRTSLEVFGTAEKVRRGESKIINFGIAYGMSAKGFARKTKKSIIEAQGYLKIFSERYSGISEFRERFLNQVLSEGCQFNNLFGRTRRVPGLKGASSYNVERARRQAFVSLIQGTAAELMKESLVRVHRWIREENIPVLLVTTIHDEVQLDVPVEYMTRVAVAVKALMEDFSEFAPIPIVVDGEYITTSWAEKKKLPM